MSTGMDRVRDLMVTNVRTVSPDMEIMRAVHLLVSEDISGLPVVDEQGVLLGILTERDCIKVALQAGYFDELGGRVHRYMAAPVQTVTPDSLLVDVAEQFAKASFRRYPVVEERRLVGMIFRRNILRALSSGAWFPGGA